MQTQPGLEERRTKDGQTVVDLFPENCLLIGRSEAFGRVLYGFS